MRQTPLLVIHTSATPPSMNIGVVEIRAWHLDRGWSDIGYHWVLRRSGKLEEGRPVTRVGAHARGFNRYSLALCLVGGVDRHHQPANNFTKAQLRRLRTFIPQVRERYQVVTICGHRDLPKVKKACPCFDVIPWVYHNIEGI